MNKTKVTRRLPVSAADVDSATKNLAGIARQTPIERSDRLSELAKVPVFLKREDQQVCRSFKVRGAYNRISTLSDDERRRGVICASAGNHAQGVAHSCRTLGIHGTIYLPMSTPRQKRDRIAALGQDWVKLVFVDGTFDKTQLVAMQVAAETNQVYVHPYDDPAVIAGQGSIAIEIDEQLGGEYQNVLIPVGGGGLVAGMATWLKENRPEVRVIAVEPAGAASVWAAHQEGRPLALDKIDSFVDGTAVGRVGNYTFDIIESLVDDIVVVDEGAVSTEMLDLYHQDGVIAEPAGALASAALLDAARKANSALNLEGTTVAIISGGNNDLSRYPEVMERSMAYQGLRHYFLVIFPQQPGALRHFLDEVLGPADDIVFFEYTKKNNRDLGPALVGVDIHRPEDIVGLRKRMEASPLHIEAIPANSELLRFLI